MHSPLSANRIARLPGHPITWASYETYRATDVPSAGPRPWKHGCPFRSQATLIVSSAGLVIPSDTSRHSTSWRATHTEVATTKSAPVRHLLEVPATRFALPRMVCNVHACPLARSGCHGGRAGTRCTAAECEMERGPNACNPLRTPLARAALPTAKHAGALVRHAVPTLRSNGRSAAQGRRQIRVSAAPRRTANKHSTYPVPHPLAIFGASSGRARRRAS